MTIPLKFRQGVVAKPTETTTKNSPLNNVEVDGNFHSIQDAVTTIEANNWVTTDRVGDLQITPSKLSNDAILFKYKFGLVSSNLVNTASSIIAKGTTSERDATPQEGYFRYNTDVGRIEWRNSTSWTSALSTSDSVYIGTTAVPVNRSSGSLTLNGVTVDNAANAATASNANKIYVGNDTGGLFDKYVLITNVSGNGYGNTFANSAVRYDAMGSALTCNITGNAYTATTASAINVTTNTTDSTTNLVFVGNSGGTQSPLTSTSLTYNATTNTLATDVFKSSSATFTGASSTADISAGSSTSGVVRLQINGTTYYSAASASFAPATDNNRTLGTSANRWSTVYAGTGTINTSDARDKTEVTPFTQNEILASIKMSKEIGTYKWLEAIQKKGDQARKHVGLTVQRAIEIMEEFNLDPFAYGFICYDAWEDSYNPDDNTLITKAGNRYSFRYDELNLFIARGFESRLSTLESLTK